MPFFNHSESTGLQNYDRIQDFLTAETFTGKKRLVGFLIEVFRLEVEADIKMMSATENHYSWPFLVFGSWCVQKCTEFKNFLLSDTSPGRKLSIGFIVESIELESRAATKMKTAENCNSCLFWHLRASKLPMLLSKSGKLLLQMHLQEHKC